MVNKVGRDSTYLPTLSLKVYVSQKQGTAKEEHCQQSTAGKKNF